MKRTDLIRFLERHGRTFLHEGAKQSVYLNRAERKVSTVPRRREIDDNLVAKICKDLGIPKP